MSFEQNRKNRLNFKQDRERERESERERKEATPKIKLKKTGRKKTRIHRHLTRKFHVLKYDECNEKEI